MNGKWQSIIAWREPVADPGFPVGGGVGPRRGGRGTPEAATFCKNLCVKKRKNWGPLGGGACRMHPP